MEGVLVRNEEGEVEADDMKEPKVKVRRDERGWPIVDCPLGHPMGWLGSVFFICLENKAHNNRHLIFVVTQTPSPGKGAST